MDNLGLRLKASIRVNAGQNMPKSNRVQVKKARADMVKGNTHPSKSKVERVMGIEPTSKAWEAFVLPLNYTRRGHDSTIIPTFTQL